MVLVERFELSTSASLAQRLCQLDYTSILVLQKGFEPLPLRSLNPTPLPVGLLEDK